MKDILKAVAALAISLSFSWPIAMNTDWRYITVLGVMIGATSLTIGVISGTEVVISRTGWSLLGGTGGSGGGGSDPNSGGAGGGGGGGFIGSGGSGGDYVNSQINIDEVHEYGGESDPSSMIEPSPISEDMDTSFSEEQLGNFREQLDQTEATLDFRMSRGNLFSEEGFLRILDIHSSSGRSIMRLAKTSKNKLAFVHDDIETGTGRAEIDLDGFEEAETFRVFLVWSRSEVRLHIGPEQEVQGTGRELRKDSMWRV